MQIDEKFFQGVWVTPGGVLFTARYAPPAERLTPLPVGNSGSLRSLLGSAMDLRLQAPISGIASPKPPAQSSKQTESDTAIRRPQVSVLFTPPFETLKPPPSSGLEGASQHHKAWTALTRGGLWPTAHPQPERVYCQDNPVPTTPTAGTEVTGCCSAGFNRK